MKPEINLITIWTVWIVNTFLDNIYLVIFASLYSTGVI